MYVTLCEAKKHLLVDNSFKDDDEYILALIDIAEDAVSINIEEFYKLKYCSTVVYMVPRA